MPKRRTEDAVHVVMTDHFIRSRPDTRDALAPLAERHDRQSGRVKALYPERLANGPETDLYMALAQIGTSVSLREDIPKLERAITAARPQNAEPYRAIAAAYRKSGRADQAVAAYRIALEKDPGDAGTYAALGDLLSGSGKIDEAIAVVQSGVARLPRDTSLLNTLSVLHARQNRFDRALDLVSSALRIDAENPLSWLNLGVCLQAKGDNKGAEAAYRQALLLQPDLRRAREYLDLVVKDASR